MQYALYMAFQGKTGGPILQDLLPGNAQQLLSVASDEGENTDLVRKINEILPDHPSAVPGDMLEALEKELEETASKTLVNQGIEGGLAFFLDPQETPAPGEKSPDPADVLHSVAGSKGHDAGFINLSFRVDAALKKQIRGSLEANVSDQALVRGSDFEFDINKRLYSNPRYLAFVKQVIEAKGSYISPVVRDFLSFYARCFNITMGEYIKEAHMDPNILRKRLEGVLGREKGTTAYALNDYDLTILGYVSEGQLPPDQDDPDATGQSFKVGGEIDPGTIVIQEIEDHVQRFLIRKFVEHTFNTHHNIRRIHFVDEAQAHDIRPDSDPLARGIRGRIQKFLLSLRPQKGGPQISPEMGDRLLLVALVIVVITLLVGVAVIVRFAMKASSP